MQFLCSFALDDVRQIVSDTMLTLKFVILLKLCLNATMEVASVHGNVSSIHRCCFAALMHSKCSADKLASKKLRARKLATSEAAYFIVNIVCFDSFNDLLLSQSTWYRRVRCCYCCTCNTASKRTGRLGCVRCTILVPAVPLLPACGTHQRDKRNLETTRREPDTMQIWFQDID